MAERFVPNHSAIFQKEERKEKSLAFLPFMLKADG
jgi:hypothetical protein